MEFTYELCISTMKMQIFILDLNTSRVSKAFRLLRTVLERKADHLRLWVGMALLNINKRCLGLRIV